ncbi:MAG: LssY C-terminal domain-containing protein [Bryobacteraceae bacterium]|nr:LssY C-terminal domain-containing protein [Bryobacteraceae bacterium]
MRGLLVASLVVCLGASAAAKQVKSREIRVPGGAAWLDTGIDVAAGEKFLLTAEGQLTYAGSASPVRPEGLPRNWRDLLRNYPVNAAGLGALIGRIGEGAAARPFLVGSRWEGIAPIRGRLFLGLNQAGSETAEGEFKVKFEQLEAPATAPENKDVELPSLTQETFDNEIPLRVHDAGGAPGDRVNFVIVGSEERVTSALGAAGWVQVDRDVGDALVAAILTSISKQAYLTMPMSELYLFGRPQDFGYAHADPIQVVAERHHFRLWKAPFTLDGHAVWVGAGTHDIGFERDQRDGKITHKIDPDVDKEREFIGESLIETGMVAKAEYLSHKYPITEAKTAHGGEFHSDGRTLILYLRP